LSGWLCTNLKKLRKEKCNNQQNQKLKEQNFYEIEISKPKLDDKYFANLLRKQNY